MTGFEEFSFQSDDGLRLAGRRYAGTSPSALPLVCLPGLTRNARDFHGLAEAIGGQQNHPPLIVLDYRGRGRSAWATDAGSYSVLQEAKDVLVGLGHLGIDRAVFVGTSRGALIIHILAMIRPELIAGAVLNDAGPRIEAEGLRAIRNTLGPRKAYPDWAAATVHFQQVFAPSFPALGAADFETMARATHVEGEDGIVADHDPRLVKQLALLDLDQPLPELWQGFQALSAVPLLVVRGEHSRLFSRDTAEKMQALHPQMRFIEVAGQGHAPLLETGTLPLEILALARRAQARAEASKPG